MDDHIWIVSMGSNNCTIHSTEHRDTVVRIKILHHSYNIYQSTLWEITINEFNRCYLINDVNILRNLAIELVDYYIDIIEPVLNGKWSDIKSELYNATLKYEYPLLDELNIYQIK